MATIREELVLADQFSPVISRYIDALGRASKASESAGRATRQYGYDAGGAAQKTAGLTGELQRLAGAYLGIQGIRTLLGMADMMATTTARLDMMNDGLQTTAELNQMIYESAQRSRGSYQQTADMVAKLGNLAGDAFDSSAQLVAFSEQLNKQIALSGASTQAADAAMLQLTQAMSSGVLRGEELNSILEQTPTIARAIADYMGVTTGKMRELASEGAVTAEVVKNALFAAADETNAKFAQMPVTWGQLWSQFQNTALMALQPILQAVSTVPGYLMENWDRLEPVVVAVAGALAVLTAATLAQAAAQWIMNSAMLASPLTWIVLGVAAVILAIYGAVEAFNRFTGSSISATGVVAGTFAVLGAQMLNTFVVPVQRAFAAFANFVGNLFNDPVTAVKVLFYDAMLTILGFVRSVAGGIESLINAIPGVTVNITGGIDSLYSTLSENREAAIAAGSYKEFVKPMEYIDLTDAYSAGYNFGSNLFSGFGGEMAGGYSGVPTYDQVSGLSDSLKGIEKSISMSEEDLKSLVDVAERRYVNNINLTAQTPVINISGQNTGRTAEDRQRLADTIRDILVEQVAAGSSVGAVWA